MIAADEDFDGTWPFAPRFHAGAGFRQHCVDEGQGRPIVLLHGQPTWGYIWRRFIPPLAATHRVVVPYHMGFGKSETPADRVYMLRTHVENLASLIEALGLRDITLVMQDWGGPIGIGYAVRHPERVHSLVLMNTVVGYPPGGVTCRTRWRRHGSAGSATGCRLDAPRRCCRSLARRSCR